MIKAFKELKRQMDARVRHDEIERDEEGRAVISMTVLKDEDFLSDFSAGSRPVVSSEVAEFLGESAMGLMPKEPLCIQIYSDCIDEREEKVYFSALREYYVRHYKQNQRDLRRNLLLSLIMAIIGVLGLTAVVLLSFFGDMPVLVEVIDIFAWVFLWEAVDQFFLERGVLRIERNRCLRFIEARILFFPLTERGA